MALNDRRIVSVPLVWFPRLLAATPKQRKQWEPIGGGIGIHWEAIDEDISVASLLQPERFMRLAEAGFGREHGRVMRQAIEQGGRQLLVAGKDGDPFGEGEIRGDDRRAALIAVGEQIEEELLWKVLTAQRWQLLKALCGAGRVSIREAARRVGRDVKAVHGDITALLNAGVLDRAPGGGVVFPYDAVKVEFLFRAR